jgi:formylglycine-generating enzyme required for sulfatase activity
MVARVFLSLIIIISGCTVLKKNPTKGNPPGTVQINDTLYIDRTEVANVHWREYLYYLADVEKDENFYLSALPDTSVWNDIKWKPDTAGGIAIWNNPFVEYYFRHPMYNNYPVVGISYEQAIEFCKWRTFVVNLGDYMRENNIKDHKAHLKDTFPIRLYYRLPTNEEWEKIAYGDSFSKQYPYGYDSVYRRWRGKYHKIFNCLYPGEAVADSTNDRLYTTDVKAFYPNSSNCYNMVGNLAEMVSEKGIAKGGSFIHMLDSCRISTDQHYNKPEMWLGFRCVAVKIK